MRKIIAFVFSLLVLFSCEEKIDWDLDTRNLPLLVIDGMISNERKPHRVVLSKPVTELNKIPEPAMGAIVAITDGSNIFLLLEDTENPGTYYTDSTIQGVTGQSYYLYINWNNREFVDSAYMPPVEPLRPFIYRKAEGNPDFYLLGDQTSDDPSIVKVNFDWSHLVNEPLKKEARALSYYYSLNTIDVNEMFKPDQEKVYFPAGSVVLRKKFSVSAKHQNFLRSMLMETEWKGGIFDVLPANISGSNQGRAVGIFSASSVVSDTNLIYPLP
ncbi:MAG: DUF4249 family protein [Bacteroidota bacterium]|nr:DUF4249 family protein [Bacteroidota bacterium]